MTDSESKVVRPRRGHRALDVWMNGEHVGTWSMNRSGTDVFQYESTWLSSEYRRPLSLSLPILPANAPHTGDVVANWFENLLPESREIRDRLRSRFSVTSPSAFDLLAAIGRDCVGAVQIAPAGMDPGDVRRVEATPMNEAEVARVLRVVRTPGPLSTHADADVFRFSLAGAQAKAVLLRMNDQWLRPEGATPTTHILKPPLGFVGGMHADMRNSVENEWLCMQFLDELGLTTAQTGIATFRDAVGTERALVVTRFDREWVKTAPEAGNGWIMRLPQEDFCQACAVSATQKYEADGGPGIRRSLELVRGGIEPDIDARQFALAQLAFWLLAATDGHAKNFGLHLRRDGYVMTPLYDVLSAWPIIGTGPNQLAWPKASLAMGLRGTGRLHRHLDEITVWHWQELARQTGVRDMFRSMLDLVERAETALESVGRRLPDDFPARVWESIAAGVRRHSERFLQMHRHGGMASPTGGA